MDITEREQTQDAIRDGRSGSGSRRRSGVRACTTTTWSTAECTGRPSCTGSSARPVTRRSRGRCVHPDDRESHARTVRGGPGAAERRLFDFEYRMVRPDGGVRWVSTHGQTYFSEPTSRRPPGGPPLDRRRRRHHGPQAGRRAAGCLPGMLSHELRTPVTAIFGGSQLLRRENLDEADPPRDRQRHRQRERAARAARREPPRPRPGGAPCRRGRPGSGHDPAAAGRGSSPTSGAAGRSRRSGRGRAGPAAGAQRTSRRSSSWFAT